MLFSASKATAIAAVLLVPVTAVLNVTESTTQYILQNDRLSLFVNKKEGQGAKVTLDGRDLTGAGKGPYLDCSCTPEGFWAPGGTGSVRLVKGIDSTGTAYGGVIMTDTYAKSNQTLEQYYFLRDGETGLHMFSRAYYFNASRPYLRELGELRTLFRPNTPLWTHLYAGKDNWASKLSTDAISKQKVVQDATWSFGATPNEPYVQQYSDFFTKYSFMDYWRSHKVHGMYADGSTSNGSSYGAWLVHNTVDTYYGGPLHQDIMVDGIVYNYIVSSHAGAQVPHLTHGFDRTWGPQFYYFNQGGTLDELVADAEQYANPTWNAEFYDSIAEHVPGYIGSAARTTFQAAVILPKGANKPIAILSENGRDVQNNTLRAESRQYWAEIDEKTGYFKIPRIAKGTYRLTIYAEGIWGWYVKDNVKVDGTKPGLYLWIEEKASPLAKEIWRIGTPDKSSGEFKHGVKPFAEKTLAPEEYRQYWGQWDFPTDFPNGVNYTVGKSDPAEDFNYIHWAVISHVGNSFRNETYYDNVNNWTVSFDLSSRQLLATRTATLTVQFAGAKTGRNNPKFVDLPYTLNVNGGDVETYVIPARVSTSCGVRSAVSCHNFAHKFVFPAKKLKKGGNSFVLSLPFNASSIETAVLPWAAYVQYDALRLELS